MSEYLRLLWVGGGIRRTTLEAVEGCILVQAEATPPGPVKTELFNLANSIRAELQRIPEIAPKCDLI